MVDEPSPVQSRVSDKNTRLSRGDGDANEAPRSRKKPRRQRPCYSCEECRRLKMKCDRQVPCSNCVRRHRVRFCNGPTSGKAQPSLDSHEPSRQQQDPRSAQQPQSSVEDVQNTSAGRPGFDGRYMQHQQYHRFPLQYQRHAQPIIPSQGPEDVASHAQMHRSGNNDEVDQIPFLAGETGPIQHPPHSPTSRTAGPLPGVPSGGIASEGSTFQAVDDGEKSGSYGTLMLSKGGRSKYLGPTAAIEWLKDSETQDVSETPILTRAPSPEVPHSSDHFQSNRFNSGTAPVAFPFNSSAAWISTRDLLSNLPPREEAWILVESYYRYCAWHHDVAPKRRFEKTFDRVYKLSEGDSVTPAVNPQEIALAFIIMAQGTMFNIEMPNYDSSAEEFLHLSERAMVKGEFLSNNMVAGLQTLHLMAHLHLQLDKGRQGDNAWPLWGLVMRLVQAMGMHRDGTRWNLPQDVVEERRKVFWECNAADTFQAHCFSRPCAINPEHCDTAFPSEPLDLNGEKSYSILRFELSQISSEILNMAMKVQKPPYTDVINLDLKLSEFECKVPFSLRCRAAFLSMPSRFPQPEAALEASPEPSRRAMTLSFQQTNLELNICETIINLHRPYYAKALFDDNNDCVKSEYAPSFLTVIERCAIIIAIVRDIHIRFPAVSTRQWNLWYHVFGSALCLGTLVLRDPGNAMANFVLAQIDAAIDLFTSLTRHGMSTPRYYRNLQWLSKLRARASSKISAAQEVDSQRDADAGGRSSEDREEGEGAEVLGWRTRLIERADQDRVTIRTIGLGASPSGPHITGFSNAPLRKSHAGGHQGQPSTTEPMIPSISLPGVTPDSTDDLLHDFWDPILLQDIFGSSHNQNPFGHNGSAWWVDDAAGLNAT